MGMIKRWMYKDNRPNLLTRILNRGWAWFHRKGMVSTLATLEIKGRKSGRIISFPVVVAPIDGERYLVSMLGNEAPPPYKSVFTLCAGCQTAYPGQ